MIFQSLMRQLLEPQNCLVNCMNEDFDKDYAGFQVLKPDEEITFVSGIGIKVERSKC